VLLAWGGIREHQASLGHEMRGAAGTRRGGVSMAGGRQGQGARKGNGVRGHRLPSPPYFFSEFAYVFRLSASIRKVASEHPFCVLIYMNSYIFHINFILSIFLSNTYLMLNFMCLTLSLAETHGLPKYARTYVRRYRKKYEKKERKKKGGG